MVQRSRKKKTVEMNRRMEPGRRRTLHIYVIVWHDMTWHGTAATKSSGRVERGETGPQNECHDNIVAEVLEANSMVQRWDMSCKRGVRGATKTFGTHPKEFLWLKAKFPGKLTS